jgi:hypothetical protein
MNTARVFDGQTRSSGQPAWNLWLGWVLASVIPWGIAALLSILAQYPNQSSSFFLSLGIWLLAPFIVSSGQWLVLRSYFPALSARSWQRASALAWVAGTIILAFALTGAIVGAEFMGFLLGLQFFPFDLPDALAVAASGAIIAGAFGVMAGAVAGFAQSNAFELDAIREGRWMLANTVGVATTWAVSTFTLLLLVAAVGLPSTPSDLVPGYTATALVTLLFVVSGPLASILTGSVLLGWIRQQRMPRG